MIKYNDFFGKALLIGGVGLASLVSFIGCQSTSSARRGEEKPRTNDKYHSITDLNKDIHGSSGTQQPRIVVGDFDNDGYTDDIAVLVNDSVAREYTIHFYINDYDKKTQKSLGKGKKVESK